MYWTICKTTTRYITLKWEMKWRTRWRNGISLYVLIKKKKNEWKTTYNGKYLFQQRIWVNKRDECIKCFNIRNLHCYNINIFTFCSCYNNWWWCYTYKYLMFLLSNTVWPIVGHIPSSKQTSSFQLTKYIGEITPITQQSSYTEVLHLYYQIKVNLIV